MLNAHWACQKAILYYTEFMPVNSGALLTDVRYTVLIRFPIIAQLSKGTHYFHRVVGQWSTLLYGNFNEWPFKFHQCLWTAWYHDSLCSTYECRTLLVFDYIFGHLLLLLLLLMLLLSLYCKNVWITVMLSQRCCLAFHIVRVVASLNL